MAYKVIYNAAEDCVCASIEGGVDLDMVHEYAREIIKHVSAHDCLRLLNDEVLSNVVDEISGSARL
jgi:succinyl-CoA synthetase beta subunit